MRPLKNEGRNRWVDDGGGERSDKQNIYTPLNTNVEPENGGPPSKKKETPRGNHHYICGSTLVFGSVP